ncbi:hypothetical protein SS1G_08437 [Sclerotinia sclerotiorum 1980 UF-70]|uniref:Uncharacterized protein n=1 Tax=Sclerotinia sclerotiorum (strain ATCC 18683 / 1980 / Ss-1) TaxID=665079 RepID=A7ESY2_SCLS1|nr:hypothetical protein SS1G_08437 [Sclerotinia sclerotiorum 1980 UF-70]EDN92574.1 hypothetical protein SS1G_08437 [Sclerotinia sclerotiorum 1980 UF-70]
MDYTIVQFAMTLFQSTYRRSGLATVAIKPIILVVSIIGLNPPFGF